MRAWLWALGENSAGIPVAGQGPGLAAVPRSSNDRMDDTQEDCLSQ